MDSVVYTSDNHIVAEYQPGDTQVLNEFSVPTRRLSLTDADGNSQSLDYVAGSSISLDFSDVGIQVDLDSTYDSSSGLDGKNIEIPPGRYLQVGAERCESPLANGKIEGVLAEILDG